MKYLCKVETSNVSLKEKYGPVTFCPFPFSDLDLAQMTLYQQKDKSSDHKQYLSKVKSFDVPISNIWTGHDFAETGEVILIYRQTSLL